MKRFRANNNTKIKINKLNDNLDNDVLSMVHFIQNPSQNTDIKKLFSRQYFICREESHVDHVSRKYKPYYNFCKKEDCCIDICGLCSFNHHCGGINNNILIYNITKQQDIEKIFNLVDTIIL